MSQGIEIVENDTDQEFDGLMAIELYERVVRQLEGRRLRVDSKPAVWLHVLSRKQADEVFRRCIGGGCGHVIRLSSASGKGKTMVFLALSPERVDIWMDGAYEHGLAQALTISLDYENRLYLDPDRLDDIAFTAWTASRGERHWKVSVQALRDGR